MKKEELINAFMEFIGENFPELIEEEKAPFNNGDAYYSIVSSEDVYTFYWDSCQVGVEG